jgi:TonB family protein
VLTYDGPACPGTEKTVRLPIKAQSPVKIVDVTPVAPVVLPPMPPSGIVEVAIQFTVDLEGIPTNLHVLTGPSGFNDAALDAVRQWRYASYTINGEPAYAPTTMRTTVTFRRTDR